MSFNSLVYTIFLFNPITSLVTPKLKSTKVMTYRIIETKNSAQVVTSWKLFDGFFARIKNILATTKSIIPNAVNDIPEAIPFELLWSWA